MTVWRAYFSVLLGTAAFLIVLGLLMLACNNAL
jgi:hypothetical protein